MIVIYAVIYDAPLDMKLILEVDEKMSSHCDLRLILEARDGHRAIGLIGKATIFNYRCMRLILEASDRSL